MCGIVGYALSRAHAWSYGSLAAATDLLAHRGPDGGMCWQEGIGEHWQVGFGHRRLAIIDLSTGGSQPMDVDGRCVITFNGEIYNYIELRDELRALGHVFKTESDTEVLVRAYLQWDTAALPRLRGMFAFALWDRAKRSLLLARDPFGKKPLFVATMGKGVAFSSEIEPLSNSPDIDRAIDMDSLQEYLLRRYVPGPNTFYKAIKKLPPGTFAVWHDGTLTTERYYTPPYANDETTAPATNGDAEKIFFDTLNDAVAIRLRSDAPFGAFLSGGLDSSTIVALMARQLQNPVRTFSVGFKEGAYSELGYAKLVAEKFETDHHELTVDSSSVPNEMAHAARHRGAPLSEPAEIPMMLLSRAACQTVKMVLTGEGSDELLGGYPKYRFERWMRVYQSALPSGLHRKVLRPLIESLSDAGRRLQVAARAADASSDSERMVAWFAAMDSRQHAALMRNRVPSRALDPFPFSSHARDLDRRLMFFDQTSWLPDNLLERADRMMMAYHVEGRMPFMDTRLSEVIARLPSALVTRGKGGKGILRRVMHRILPAEIISRDKVGFRVPTGQWFRSTLYDFVDSMLDSPSTKVTAILDRTEVQRMIYEHQTKRKNHESAIWTLLNLEQFLRISNLTLP